MKKSPTLGTPGMPPLVAIATPLTDDTVLKVGIFVAPGPFLTKEHEKNARVMDDPTSDSLTVSVDNPDDTGDPAESIEIPVDLVPADPCDATSLD